MAKVLLALLVGADAARFSRRKNRSEPAQVDGLYTFGAPGSASPGLKNERSASGCFPGLRVWTAMNTGGLFNSKKVDQVVTLAGLAGFRHPWVRGVELHVNKSEETFADCQEGVDNLPQGRGDGGLHDKPVYVRAVAEIEPSFTNMTKVATQFSYHHGDSSEVAEGVREFGYGLVGTGFDDGSTSSKGGPQVSHLFQIPETLECILTFQGSSSLGDWLGNADFSKEAFCGLQERVHRGFRNHFRRMVRNPTWQSNVRPHLGKCAKLYAVGHSLGGAMAELFTACTSHAPASGDGFDEDYQYIGWTRETPARLPYH